jgi:hypothetical protein
MGREKGKSTWEGSVANNSEGKQLTNKTSN